MTYAGENNQKEIGKGEYRLDHAQQLHEEEERKPGEKENDGKAGDKPPEQNGEKGRRSRPLTLHWEGDARRGI
ncbi:hypothetical protein EAH77_21955 [Ewingella americana]|uniref:Uncharacterized protein n=1 Tax=Ewingella americana TaxID=41202 RepID=A0A502G6D5_9GAMM|nr:hypothetical protein EAH77_21955 [Ewingella americana]